MSACLSLDLSNLALSLLVSHGNVTVQVLGPGDLSAGRREDDLNVAGVSLVRVDSTVGPVSPSAGFLFGAKSVGQSCRSQTRRVRSTHRGLLHNNVLDGQLLLLQVLGLSVGLGVLDQVEDESNRLLGPTSLGGTKLLGLGSTTDSTGEPSERNNLLVLLDVREVSVGLLDVHACDANRQ